MSRKKFMEAIPLMESEKKISENGKFADFNTEETYQAYVAGTKSLYYDIIEHITDITGIYATREDAMERLSEARSLAREAMKIMNEHILNRR